MLSVAMPLPNLSQGFSLLLEPDVSCCVINLCRVQNSLYINKKKLAYVAASKMYGSASA